MKTTNQKPLTFGGRRPRSFNWALQPVVVALSLTAAACGGLTPAGTAAKIMKADPPPECEELGSVTGTAMGWCDIACQKLRMRNEAGKLGANYVRYEVAAFTGSTGTAYRCPEPSNSARHTSR